MPDKILIVSLSLVLIYVILAGIVIFIINRGKFYISYYSIIIGTIITFIGLSFEYYLITQVILKYKYINISDIFLNILRINFNYDTRQLTT